MGRVAFGGYRISNRSQGHKEALKLALENGCKLIDTSANYTDGESESLIGEILKESKVRPLLISKVGYIQGKNLQYYNELNKDQDCLSETVDFGDHLKHCIHPEFIVDQVERSLKRLGVETLDGYLLHNPEYYLKTDKSNKNEFYQRILKAFMCLEDLVAAGKIKYYGVSSNTLILPREDKEAVDLEKLLDCAKRVESNHHFKYVQFPLNLLELGALERQYAGKHLIEYAKENGLITMINRPLNAFSSGGLLRLARYEKDVSLTEKFANEFFIQKMSSLFTKWEEVKEDKEDRLFDIPFMQQMSEIWYKQYSEDAVSQIFFQHFFPFIARIWGKDLTSDESQPFYDLYEKAVDYSRINMNDRAEQFRLLAIDKGLISDEDKPLSVLAIEKYLSFGVDYILVGMKRLPYVEELKTYF